MTSESGTVRWTGDAGWAEGQLDGLVVGHDGLEIADGRDSGTFLAPPYRPAEAFDRAVPFWNARTWEDDWVEVRARVLRGGESLCGPLRIATWSRAARGVRDPGCGPVKIDQDTLLVEGGADTIQLEVTLRRGPEGPGPRLSRLGVTTYLGRRSHPGEGRSGEELAPRYRGPFHSQRAQEPAIAMRICGPTALTMALGAFGISRTPVEVARAAEDPEGAIAFGNWAYLAATAAEHGIAAEVIAMHDLAQLARELTRGRLAILSVSFGKGELPGSPVQSTEGHLILARGFDEHGNVVVDDPAGRSEAEGRVCYPRRELARVWRRGIAIVLDPAPVFAC